MLLLLGQNHFSVEKMLDFDVFNECVTDQQTDRPTDTAYYRDARTHLKTQSNVILTLDRLSDSSDVHVCIRPCLCVSVYAYFVRALLYSFCVCTRVQFQV